MSEIQKYFDPRTLSLAGARRRLDAEIAASANQTHIRDVFENSENVLQTYGTVQLFVRKNPREQRREFTANIADSSVLNDTIDTSVLGDAKLQIRLKQKKSDDQNQFSTKSLEVILKSPSSKVKKDESVWISLHNKDGRIKVKVNGKTVRNVSYQNSILSIISLLTEGVSNIHKK